MAWGTFGASPGGPPNPGFAGASAREAGGIRRARRLAVLGTAAGLASGLGIQRRAAHAKMGPGGTGGGTGSDGQGKRPAVGAFTHAMAGAFLDMKERITSLIKELQARHGPGYVITKDDIDEALGRK